MNFFDNITANMRQTAQKMVKAAGQALKETCPICGNRRKIRHDKLGIEVDCICVPRRHSRKKKIT